MPGDRKSRSLISLSSAPCSVNEILVSVPKLSKLPPSEWRSLGGYLDYEFWPERQRFKELDNAIRMRCQDVEPREFARFVREGSRLMNTTKVVTIH
jgi:hypothetical protein